MWHPFKLSPALILLKTCYLLTKIQCGKTGRWQLPPSSMQMTIISSPPLCKYKHWIIPDRNTLLHLEIWMCKGDTCSHLWWHKAQLYPVILWQIILEITAVWTQTKSVPSVYGKNMDILHLLVTLALRKRRLIFLLVKLLELFILKKQPIQFHYNLFFLIALWYC